VERFRRNLDVYKKSSYNEAQVRIEFINPFFEALGWDVSNRQGFAEQYKEVIYEDVIKVGRSTRAPDYSFRIGGQRKFFVEAKKPVVNIKEDVSPAYQLRRYAWSAKLPLSVVTDFEEFSVFDCRIKPDPNDKPSVGRIAYYTFDEYLDSDKFDAIYDVFSKEAVLKGGFDKYAESTKGKKGTAEVDSEFLKEIESWRELLAKNIALRNPDVTIYELNYAVQKIIDRIIFLRICEDRGIEHYGQLQTKAESGDVYTHLLNHFKLAESKYDSGIFDFDTDRITPGLSIDDRVLKTIIQSLYYPKSPYEFSVLGVEILGNVYEQFLGKVIRLTAGHQAKVETKPEVKKAGGVYYTPQYIVDYIVKNTVGKLVEGNGKTPEEIAAIKILDPACGSGSFLIGAYTYLLRYHLDWYLNNKPKQHKDAVFQVRENEWYLTTAEKKRILLNNIFGVDIDPQAVEVTKLSLLLKVLEHESRESIDQQVKLGLEGVLPNLEGNVKCGNSLIGSDFYGTGQQETLFDEEEMRRVNVFDWDDEGKGFGEIMKRGGFDAVVGNPPYLNLKRGFLSDAEKSYFEIFYKTARGQYDSFVLFIEKAIGLLAPNGYHAFIVPKPVLVSENYEPVRQLFLEHQIISISNSGSPFGGVGVESTIVNVCKKRTTKGEVLLEKITGENEVALLGKVKQGYFCKFPFTICSYLLNQKNSALFEKISQESFLLGSLAEKFSRGIEAGKKAEAITTVKTPNARRLLRGEDVTRYAVAFKGLYYEASPKNKKEWKDKKLYVCPEKILIRRVANSIIATLDHESYWTLNTLYTFVPKEGFDCRYLIGILNSKLISYYFRVVFLSDDKLFPYVRISQLEKIPIHTIDFSNPAEKAQHDELVALVDNMLELQKKYHEARMERDKELYERQIRIVDAQIDRLVYDLYGLTEEEIRLIGRA
ncbi:MAG: N-6 DNA methylase, partial [Methanophagales archaeon]|nr:N-6 DNA methylase [Methanophagales archaeon]